MNDTTEKERCARGCIWLGAGVGLAIALMFWLIAAWGFVLSIAAGIVLGGVAGFAFTAIFCGKLSGPMLLARALGLASPLPIPHMPLYLHPKQRPNPHPPQPRGPRQRHLLGGLRPKRRLAPLPRLHPAKRLRFPVSNPASP